MSKQRLKSIINSTPIKLLFLLGCLFSLVQNYETISFSDGYENSFKATDLLSLKISLKSGDITDFMHVIVSSQSATNQIVYFSNDDEKCINGRQLMAMKPTGDVDLFLTSTQVSPSKNNYVCVQCQKSSSCQFTVKLFKEDSCVLQLGDQYSYYVYNEDSKSMRFTFTKANGFASSRKLVTEPLSMISIWAKGSSPLLQSNINVYSAKKKSFVYGDMYLFEEGVENSSDYELEVEAEIGDLVTVGGKYISEGNSLTNLVVNSPEVMGYLIKGLHEEECFYLYSLNDYQYGVTETVYVNGLIYDKIGRVYYKNKKDESFGEKNILDSSIIDIIYGSTLGPERKFCVSFAQDETKYSVKELIFSLQLTDHKHMDYNPHIYSPQLLGILYPHYLTRGEVAIFAGMQTSKEASEIVYNMKSVEGFPDMLFDICTTFPNCNYDESKLSTITNPRHVNRMTTYRYVKEEENEITPISAYQPLLIVNCTDGTKKKATGEGSEEERESTTLCHFETSIASERDTVHLHESDSFAQYVLAGENDKYIIEFSGEKNVKKVFLDLNIFSGDVEFETDLDDAIVHKYFLSNKVFYSITVDSDRVVKEIEFGVTAYRNSFYVVRAQIVREGDAADLSNLIESGASYLESVEVNSQSFSKTIRINNLKTAYGFPFLTNFYSLNCDFDVSRNYQSSKADNYIPMFNGYGQDIITTSDLEYYSGKYEYKIDAVDSDPSQYERKLCMIYISGIELENTNTGMEREISIPEGIPQQYIFVKTHPRIKYAYHISDLDDSVVINFNLINKMTYNIVIYFGYTKSEKTHTINRNSQIIIKPPELEENCEKHEVCTIAIDITLVPDASKPDLEPRLETTIEQVQGPPTYLPKNIVKNDVLIGNYTKYFYVDIGKNDAGYVSVNYRRGGGKLYGKIVKKNQVEKDENADWRDKYKFPDNMLDSLRYESYLKKLSFSPEETEECDQGCYLLISITSSNVVESIDEYLPSLYSILAYVAPVDLEIAQLPKITVKINDYIVGNVGKSTEDVIQVFYDVWIPYDADYIIFDWQSDRSSLYVNVGEERPTMDKVDFKFDAIGHDTIFKLTKEQILEDSPVGRKIMTNSIKDIHLTLGVWTNFTDTYYTSVYALKVHLADNEFDIYHVRSDQKVLCEPTPMTDGSGLYRCLYAIIFDRIDIMSHITAYPKSQDESANIKFYASIVDSELVEKNDIRFLKSNIPTKDKNDISYDETGNPYIYLPAGEPGKCLYISVITNKQKVIEMLSSANENEIEVTPNPSTTQLFAIREKSIVLNFQTSQDLLINIVSLNGKGELYWETEEWTHFYLRGKDDRLTLTSGKINKDNVVTKLVIQSTSEIEDLDDPGMMFYITYYPRSVTYNIDQLKVGKTIEFNYRESDFPINFFVPLSDTSKDISVTLNFFDLSDSQYRERFFSEKDILIIWAVIIPEEDAYRAKYSQKNRPERSSSSIVGVFNSALNVATVFLSKNDINNFRIAPERKPTLFFSVEKGENVKFNYNRISAEITILQEGNNIPATEKVYQYGKLSNNDYSSTTHTEFILTINKRKPYMRIECAFNSMFLNWSVSKTKGSRTNDTFTEQTALEDNGRTLFSFKVPDIQNTQELYLNIFLKDKNARINPELGNYVFKYMNGPDIDAFSDYDISDRKINLESVKTPSGSMNYTVKFVAIPGSEKYKVSYFLKVVGVNDYIENELMDTIAITESKSSTLQIDNPSVDSDGYVSMTAYDISKVPKYIMVLAKIKEGPINEFITFEPYVGKPDEQPTGELIEIDYIPNFVTKEIINAKKKTNFLLNFGDNIPQYIQVQTTSFQIPNQILYFSPTDPNGMKNREQLAQEGAGTTSTMWLKKDQFVNQKLYISVECKYQDTCSYNIKFSGLGFIEQESKFIYNYYVSSKNTEMVFHVNRYASKDKYKYVTFYVKGSTNAQISITDLPSIKATPFKFGQAMTFQIPSSYLEDYFELKVTAKEGDYLSVGGKVDYGNPNDGNILLPNSAEISGYLIKGEYEDECNVIDVSSEEFAEVQEVYISAIFYNRIAEVYFRNTDYEEMSSTETIETGSYYGSYDFSENRLVYVCVRFPTEENRYTIKDIPYSLQVIDANHKVGLPNIFSPQGNGIIYPRLLTKDSLVYYSGVKSSPNTQDVTYNMLTIYGFPKMFIHKCETFPVCDYESSEIERLNGLIKPHEINRMTTWLTDEVNKSPIDPVQYVLIVKCQESASSSICVYQTSIFGNNDQITLLENKPFSQYILKGEESNFIIDFNYENGLQKLYLDTLVLSGDVTFNIKNQDTGKEIDYHKYYLANKIFYSINLANNKGLTRVRIDIKAAMNSFYNLEYKLVREAQDQLSNNIFTGINYLVPIDPAIEPGSKLIEISNLNVENKNVFLTNFYSLNCKFDIVREDATRVSIKSYNNYAQEVLSTESEDYYTIQYKYNITITEEDPSSYDHKMCMLYVTGIELTSEDAVTQREIVIGENVPQRVIFEKGFDKVRYMYPHTEQNVNIVIDFKVMDLAKYELKVIYNYEEIDKIQLSASQLIYVPPSKLEKKCKEKELCVMIVEIKLLEATSLESSPMIETSIRQIQSVPTYFPKGIARQDYVVNDKFLYLYTDVGKDERGFITVDFLRGSGKIYGKIVKKNQETVDDGAIWRQYKYPTTFAESLKYDGYSKKMTFSAEDTKNCQQGCYLLLGIQSSVSGLLDEDYRFYPVTIISSITPSIRIYTDIPKIALQVDEYAIGSIVTLDTSERLYEFYEVYLPYDADVVQFDWQSDVAELFVGVGDERPTKENAPFKLGSKRTDTILEIKKEEILDWAKRNEIPIPVENSLKNMNLVIGIGAEVIDSISYTIYSLKVHLPIKKNKEQLNIYKVDSDQKTLCKPTKNRNNQYECLYMVLYTDFNLLNDFISYAESQDKFATVHMYADFISKDIYNTFDVDSLSLMRPTENKSTYNSKKDKVNYIYLKTGKLNSYLYINVVSDTPGIIEFMSSFYTYDKIITPNPSTVQLFALTEDSVTFSFSTSKDLLINLVSLNGEGEIYWENEPESKYHIRGRDDRLALTSFTHKEENKGLNLIVKKKTASSSLKADDKTMENPGFAFSIEYYRRATAINFDEIIAGKTFELAYRDTSFPISFYSKTFDLDNDVNIFVNFHELANNDKKERIYKNSNFHVIGSIIKEKTVYNMKTNPDLSPGITVTNPGVYDPSLKIGQIYISKNDIKKYNLKLDDKPTIFFGLDFIQDIATEFKKITAEISIIRENTGVPVTEKLYQFGKIGGSNAMNIYKLKNNQLYDYMRIQFAANSGNVDFAISTEVGAKANTTSLLTAEKKRGLTFVTFKTPNDKEYLYLNVFVKDANDLKTPKLNNYVFKYINAAEEKLFFEYEIFGNKPSLTKTITNKDNNKKDVEVTFNRINADNVDITYSMKVVHGKTRIQKENMNTIALIESDSTVVQVDNPAKNSDNTVTMKLSGVDGNIADIQVIAQIFNGIITEYVAYEAISLPYESGVTTISNIPAWLIVLVVGVFLAVVLVLVIVIFNYKAKNKDLMDQVNKISFQQSMGKENPDGGNLLLSEEKNELD